MKEIVFNAQFNSDVLREIDEIALQTGILPETAKLLFSRGFTSPEAVKKFLKPGKKNFHNPFLLKGMTEAVDRIMQAKQNGETVLVYGDYDADGISASTVMTYALKELGIQTLTVIPERADGYGLNEEIVTYYAEEYFIDLIITVDCGISDVEKVEFIKNELGIDVIVTDHHEVPEIIPDTIVINPKIGGYPFDSLCGAGVALKVAYALIGDKADKYVDLAALATVADSMSLTGENRDIVYEGLKIFNSKNIRSSYKALLSTVNAREITAQTLAYNVSPRINAAGRMGDANSALQLFLTEDENEIFKLASMLTSYNTERQIECDKLYNSAKEKLLAQGAYRNIIMLYDEKWPTGLAGIVAAKLVEEYSRPVILFAGGNGGSLKGSARSIENINLFEAISQNKEWLIEFGGHAQAAGLSIYEENFSAFYNAVDTYLSNNYSAEDFVPKIHVDGKIEGKFSMEFAEELDLLEPCGVGNKKPVFYTEVNVANARRLKPQATHLVFSTPSIEMLWFGGERHLEILNSDINKKIIFEPNVSVFNNQKSLKGFVKEYVLDYKGEDLSEQVFEKQLASLLENQNSNVTSVTMEDINSLIQTSLKSNYGTAYIVNNVDTLSRFPALKKMQIGVFAPSENNLRNTIIICPQTNIKGFDKVIYLDNPPAVTVTGNETYINKDISGTKLFDGILTDRQVFADVFVMLKSLNGKKFEKAVDFCIGNRVKYNVRQVIFCISVFTELKIFEIADGIFRFNPSVKSDLRNSLIYTRTQEITGNV